MEYGHSDRICSTFIKLFQKQLARMEEIEKVNFINTPGVAFPGSVVSDTHTLVALFSGEQTNHFYDAEERLVSSPHRAHELLYVGPQRPVKKGWVQPCQRLGVAIYGDFLSASWNDFEVPVEYEESVLPDIWFTSKLRVPPDLKGLFDALHGRENYTENSSLTLGICSLIYHKILELLHESLIQRNNGPSIEWHIKAQIENSLHLSTSCKLVAARLNISPDYVSRVLRKDGGFTAYLNQVRINRAKDLLKQSDKKVAMIASLCGFTSTSYFIKVFRKACGCTPKAYRAQISKGVSTP